MTARGRELATVLLLGLAAAGLAVWATTGGRSWGTATVRAEGLPPRELVVTARTAVPWVVAAALVALAGTGAVLATAGRWRRVVGVLVAACGLLVLGGALLGGSAVEDALRDEAAATASGSDSAAVDAAVEDVGGRAWRWAAAVGGTGILVAGALTAVRGPGWPGMGRRYQQPARRSDDDDPWRALDHGHDPTAGP